MPSTPGRVSRWGGWPGAHARPAPLVRGAGWTGGALSSSLLAGGPVLLAFLLVLYAVHLAVVVVALSPLLEIHQLLPLSGLHQYVD